MGYLCQKDDEVSFWRSISFSHIYSHLSKKFKNFLFLYQHWNWPILWLRN